MLTCAFARESALIFALDAAEKAVAVDLSQVENQSVQLGVSRLDFRLQSLKRKLDFFLRVEDFLDESLAEVDISLNVAEGQLRGDLRLLDSLVVLLGREFEVLDLALCRCTDHESVKVRDGGVGLLLRRVDQPGKPLEVVHLERSTEDDLLQPLRRRVHGLLELGPRHECRDLLEVERATVRVKLVKLGPVQVGQVIPLDQVQQVERHLAEKYL